MLQPYGRGEEQVRFNQLKKVSLLLLLIAVVSSCVRVETGTSAPTVGEEIIDQVKARQAGAIDDEEFDEAKKRILISI